MDEDKTRFIDPVSDFGFKILYGFPECADELKELLEHVIPEKKITELNYIETESLAPEEDKKKVVCDIRCRDQNGDWFIVEMQKAPYSGFGDRLMVYASHTVVKLLKKGLDYGKADKLYVISVLNYMLLVPEDTDECRNNCVREAMVRMTDSGSILSDKIKYIFLQLPKGSEWSSRWTERWSWHMKNVAEAEDVPQIDDGDDHFKRLYRRAERCNIEKELLKTYDDMIRDERQIEAEKRWAVDEALAKGLAEGEAKGRTEGRAEGMAEVARNMKAKGIDAEVIAECTGLSEEQIAQL